MRYNIKSKLRFIRYFKTKNLSISKIAKKEKIPKQTLARWIKSYNLFGKKGLENKKPGAKEKPINPDIEKKVLDLWNKRKRSLYKMIRDLRIKNHNQAGDISKRKIEKIYEKHGFSIIESK